MTRTVSSSAPKLFRGEWLTAGSAAYDGARRVFNARFDRHPAIIARCAVPADIIATVRFARDNELPLAVRGGGMHMAGFASIDAGLIIDLSLMRSIRVDARSCTAECGGGALGGDLLVQAASSDLAGVTGVLSKTGLAGLTLHGGVGYLSPRAGWACDNVLALNVVTADGRCLTVSATEHPDLFWAMRGAGANFGVTTSMTIRLHAMAKAICTGTYVWALSQAREVLEFLCELDARASDDFFFYCDLGLPDPTQTQDDLDRPVLSVMAAHLGEPKAARTTLRLLETLGTPLSRSIDEMSYVALHHAYDSAYPPVRQCWDEVLLPTLPGSTIDLLIDEAENLETGASRILLYPYRGAMCRPPAVDNAFALRDRLWAIEAVSFWDDPSADNQYDSWTRNVVTRVSNAGLHSGKAYVNAISVCTEEQMGAAFGPETYARLRRVKRVYDPENVFRNCPNVPPSPGQVNVLIG